MAISLELTDGTTTTSLLSGVLQLAHGSWQTHSAPPEGEYKMARWGGQFDFKRHAQITESWDLNAFGTASQIRTAIYTLEQLLEKALQFHMYDQTLAPVWLKWASEGETARQCLVYGGNITYNSTQARSPFLETEGLSLRLSITRHPFWEGTSYTQYDGVANLSALGGMVAVTNIAASAPARIAQFAAGGVDGKGTIKQFWAGIRPTYGGATYFNPLLEAEPGDAGTDAVFRNDSDDASVYAGTAPLSKLRVTYVATDLKKRWSSTIGDHVASYNNTYHMQGNYLVLGRFKVSAGTSGIQLRYGAESAPDTTFVQNEMVYVENTSWMLVPLGKLSVPAVKPRNTFGTSYAGNEHNAMCSATELQIWAEQVDGTGTYLDFDCLILIPSDHMISASDVHISYDVIGMVGDDAWAYVITHPDDTLTSVSEVPSSHIIGPAGTFESVDWYAPVGGGTLVFAGQRAASSVSTDAVAHYIRLVPRYQSYSES